MLSQRIKPIVLSLLLLISGLSVLVDNVEAPVSSFGVIKEKRVYDVVSTVSFSGAVTSGVPQTEPAVAVNPIKPGPNYNIIVAYNNISSVSPLSLTNPGVAISVSTNGGDSWTHMKIPTTGLTQIVCCDPGVTFQTNGTAFVIAQTIGGPGTSTVCATSPATRIFITKSVPNASGDAGATWSAPVVISSANGNDRPAIAIDTAVNRAGGSTPTEYIYVAFQNRFGCLGTGPSGNCEYVARSINSGSSWSTPVQLCTLSGATTGFRNDIAIGPSGEVYVAWQGNNGRHVICKSTSWPTFTCANPTALSWSGFPTRTCTNPSGRRAIPNTCIRTNEQPKLTVDRDNNLYLVWSSFGPGSTVATGDGDILMSKATGGSIATWSSPVQVNTDSTLGANDGVDQFFPDVVYDPNNNVLFSAFYDRRDFAVRKNFHLYFGVSFDGGTSFSNGRITSVGSNPGVVNSTTRFLGDYIGSDIAAMPGGGFAVAWTDLRDGFGQGSIFGGCTISPPGCNVYSPPADGNSNIYIAIVGSGTLFPFGIDTFDWTHRGIIGSRFEAFSVSGQISVLPSVPGQSSSVTLSVNPASLQPGVNATFNPSSGIPPFTSTLTVNSATGLNVGTFGFTIEATDAMGIVSRAGAKFTIGAEPFIVIDRVFADPGQLLELAGTGFAPSSNIVVRLDGTSVATLVSGGQGTVVGTVTVPQVGPGVHVIEASDPTGLRASNNLRTPLPPAPGDDPSGMPVPPGVASATWRAYGPRMDGVDFRFYSDSTSEEQAFQSGQIDLTDTGLVAPWWQGVVSVGGQVQNFFTYLNAYCDPALPLCPSSVLRQGLVGGTASLNPLTATAASDRLLLSTTYQPLLMQNPQAPLLQLLNWMTIRYTTSFDAANNRTIVTFTLRNDLRWHDGRSLTADDVVYTFRAYRDLPSVHRSLVAPVISIVALSPSRVQMDLQGNVLLPSAVSQFIAITTLPIVPKHVWAPVCGDPPSNLNCVSSSFDPLARGMVIGSGPHRCLSLFSPDLDTVGTGCAVNPDGSRGGQSVGPGGRIRLSTNPHFMRGPPELQGSSYHKFSWADRNNDGKVDILDLADAAISFDRANPYWDHSIFGSNDGVVDIAEIATLAVYFDHSLTGPFVPSQVVDMHPRVDVLESSLGGLTLSYKGVLDDPNVNPDAIFGETYLRYSQPTPSVTWLADFGSLGSFEDSQLPVECGMATCESELKLGVPAPQSGQLQLSSTLTVEEGQTRFTVTERPIKNSHVISRRVDNIRPTQLAAMANLEAASGASFEIRFAEPFGVPGFFAGRWQTDPTTTDPTIKAIRFLETYADLFRFRTSIDTFTGIEVGPCYSVGDSSVRLQQNYHGIPVCGAQLIVHLRGEDVAFVHGTVVPDITAATTPIVTQTQARSIAEADLRSQFPNVQFSIQLTNGPGLRIYHSNVFNRFAAVGLNALAWFMVLRTEPPTGEWFYFVDATTGVILDAFDNSPSHGSSQVYDASTSPDTSCYVNHVLQPLCPSPAVEVSRLDANMDNYYNYLLTVFGWNGLDNSGNTLVGDLGTLEGRARVPNLEMCNPPNAAWDCRDDEVMFSPGLVTQDIVAHELTHGLDEESGANLIYSFQSGALDEHLADTFGEYLDCRLATCNWLVGQDAFGIVFGPIRSMSNPSDPAFGDPDHMDNFFVTTSDNDNGGVHTNSGIPNKVAFLIAAGGTHPLSGITVVGLGIPGTNTKAEKLIFNTLINTGLTSSATFYEYRDVMLQTCKAMIGGTEGMTSFDCRQVFLAWLAVGIGGLNQNVAAATNEDEDLFGRSLARGNFNGDLYEDLAVGVPYENDDETNDGMVIVFYGSANGLGGGTFERIGQETTGMPATIGNENGDLWGYSLASGNFNGDLYDDLAIGSPYEDVSSIVNAGAIWVLYGSASGLLPVTDGEVIHQDVTGVPGVNEAGDTFGWSLASGDFNNDPYDDLAVGGPYENEEVANDGDLWVLYGSGSGLLPIASAPLVPEVIHQESAGMPATLGNEVEDRWAYSLASGDFDGDLYDDLALGAPYEDVLATVNAGAVWVLYGSASGLLPVTDGEVIHQETGVGATNEAEDRFGWSLVSGNFNGGLYDDLAVGVPFENDDATNDGMVVIIYGSSSGLDPVTSVERIGQNTFGVPGVSEDEDEFGWSLASGNFNGDSYDDLAVGVPYENLEATDDGVATVLIGSGSGLLPAASSELVHQESVGGVNQASDRFGYALAVGDFDGNGNDDLAASAPYQDFPGGITNAGTVYVREF